MLTCYIYIMRCLPRPHTSVYAQPPRGCGLGKKRTLTTTEWTYHHISLNRISASRGSTERMDNCPCLSGYKPRKKHYGSWLSVSRLQLLSRMHISLEPQAREICAAKSTRHIYLQNVTSDETPQNQLYRF